MGKGIKPPMRIIALLVKIVGPAAAGFLRAQSRRRPRKSSPSLPLTPTHQEEGEGKRGEASGRAALPGAGRPPHPARSGKSRGREASRMAASGPEGIPAQGPKN